MDYQEYKKLARKYNRNPERFYHFLPIEGELKTLVEKREYYKEKKDFENTDKIKKIIEKEGLVVQDTNKGTRIILTI